MDEPLLSTLHQLASQFRTTIEKCEKARLPEGMKDFPDGACSDASLLLAKFLEQRGLGLFDLQGGERGGSTHAWLQRDDLVVDITADQFPDMELPVIAQHNSSWHDTFSGKPQHIADFELYKDDPAAAAMLRGCYHFLLEQLPASKRSGRQSDESL